MMIPMMTTNDVIRKRILSQVPKAVRDEVKRIEAQNSSESSSSSDEDHDEVPAAPLKKQVACDEIQSNGDTKTGDEASEVGEDEDSMTGERKEAAEPDRDKDSSSDVDDNDEDEDDEGSDKEEPNEQVAGSDKDQWW